jgi:hypothetical protein
LIHGQELIKILIKDHRYRWSILTDYLIIYRL